MVLSPVQDVLATGPRAGAMRMGISRACAPRPTAAHSDRSGGGPARERGKTGGYGRRSRSRDPGRCPAWPLAHAAPETAGCMPAGSRTRRAARGFRSCAARAVPVARAQRMAAPRPEVRAWAGRVSVGRGGDGDRRPREGRAVREGPGGRPDSVALSRGMTRPGEYDLGSRLSALGSRLSALGSRLSYLWRAHKIS